MCLDVARLKFVETILTERRLKVSTGQVVSQPFWRAVDRGSRDRLRFVRSCSAPLSPSTVQRMEETFGAPVLAAYGMTEATHPASSVLPLHNESTRLHTVGMPTGVSVRIVHDGKSAATGSTGEIWLSGPRRSTPVRMAGALSFSHGDGFAPRDCSHWGCSRGVVAEVYVSRRGSARGVAGEGAAMESPPGACSPTRPATMASWSPRAPTGRSIGRC
jgi:hypothetical protein